MEIRPRIGGFFRPFGTTWFIIEFLKGNGPQDSKEIDPDIGSPMTDIHSEYKSALHRALYKMRYSSFTRYFGHLKRIGWVIKSGMTEPSTIQDDYPQAPSRVFYRLTVAGWKATPEEIADPIQTLYQYSREQRSAKRSRYARPLARLFLLYVSLPRRGGGCNCFLTQTPFLFL